MSNATDTRDTRDTAAVSTAPTRCYYVRGSTTIIDTIDPSTGLTSIYRRTREVIHAAYPEVEDRDLDEACAEIAEAQRTKFCKPPTIITREDFIEMLEILPPAGWVRRAGEESFKMGERTCGNLTEIFARIGETHYRMCDDIRTTHDQIIAKCRAIAGPTAKERT